MERKTILLEEFLQEITKIMRELPEVPEEWTGESQFIIVDPYWKIRDYNQLPEPTKTVLIDRISRYVDTVTIDL